MTDRLIHPAGDSWHHICGDNELEDAHCVEFVVVETPGFVFRYRGQLNAYINRCPHLGIELNWMPGRFFDIEQTFIQCSTHGALFKPHDGHCIAGPCAGEQLASLPVRERNGQVEVYISPD